MPTNNKHTRNIIELKADIRNFKIFMDFIESFLVEMEIGNEIRTQILMASEEIIVNIINYAYPKDQGDILIEIVLDKEEITITFADSGMQFNPLTVPEADTELPLEERRTGGLGILMIKKLTDNTEYEYKDGKNYLTITKYLN